MDNRPIGVFDSGIGGLTVVRELIKRLPAEDIVYFGDTARLPYGTKSGETIIRFSIENAIFLLRYNVKLIIAACNTSSSMALPALKKSFRVPIIGVIKPGSEDAVASTKNGKIGVIGTPATIKSKAHEREISKSGKVKVFSKSCPLLVPLVEEGWLNSDITRRVISYYLEPLKKKRIDTLILGCTHYPLLKNSIRKVLGRSIALVDYAVSTAEAAAGFIKDAGMESGRRSGGRHRFFVSDDVERFKRVGQGFLGRDLLSVRRAPIWPMR